MDPARLSCEDPPVDATLARQLAAAAASFAGVEALALHGSRARGDGHPGSDWDFAYLPAPGASVDHLGLLGALIDVLGTDDVDLADLSRASGLLRFHVARDGRLLFERTDDVFFRFRFEAARFWFDIAPLVRQASDARFRDWEEGAARR